MGKIAERIRKRYAERAGATPATRDDLNKLKRELDGNLRKAMRSEEGTGRKVAVKAARMAKRGLGNIERSLSSPSDVRRPKIAQMPARRSDIGIVQSGLNSPKSLDYLKTPGLRGQSLMWAPGMKKKRN